MLNFFKKKTIDLSSIPDAWELAQGTSQGKPIFIRKRNVENLIGSSDFPFQIGIAVPLINPTEDGLPKHEEAETLFSIEGKIEAALSSDNESIFVIAITTSGMREFVFYTKEWKPEYFEVKIKEVAKTTVPHELQFMMQHDPTWETFRKFGAKSFPPELF